MEIKKISFVSVFHPYRGGIALFSDHLNNAFKKKWECNAVNFNRQYPGFLFPGKTQYVEKNALVTQSENIRIIDSIQPFSYLKAAKQINDNQPDLLLTRYWMTFFAPALGMITRKVTHKAVKIALLDNVIPHEKRFFDDRFNHYYLQAQDGFVVMSKQVLSDLKKYIPEPKYLLLDHPKYSQFGDRKDPNIVAKTLQVLNQKKTILFFGLIRDYKGLDLLIDAFSLLSDEFQLIIAGECYGSFEGYQQQIETNPNHERIFVFNRFIPDDQIADFFSVADLCVLPYRTATQSGIHAISDHFETPTLVTNVGGLPEYITPDFTGVLVDEVNSNAISEGILHFFELAKTVDFQQNIREKNATIDWTTFASEIVHFAQEIKDKK